MLRRLTLITIVLSGVALLQLQALRTLRWLNARRGRSGRLPLTLPASLVPPRLLLTVAAITVMPASQAAGQLIGSGGASGMYLLGGVAAAYVAAYVGALTYVVSGIALRPWALGVVYGTNGTLHAPRPGSEDGSMPMLMEDVVLESSPAASFSALDVSAHTAPTTLGERPESSRSSRSSPTRLTSPQAPSRAESPMPQLGSPRLQLGALGADRVSPLSVALRPGSGSPAGKPSSPVAWAPSPRAGSGLPLAQRSGLLPDPISAFAQPASPLAKPGSALGAPAGDGSSAAAQRGPSRSPTPLVRPVPAGEGKGSAAGATSLKGPAAVAEAAAEAAEPAAPSLPRSVSMGAVGSMRMRSMRSASPTALGTPALNAFGGGYDAHAGAAPPHADVEAQGVRVWGWRGMLGCSQPAASGGPHTARYGGLVVPEPVKGLPASGKAGWQPGAASAGEKGADVGSPAAAAAAGEAEAGKAPSTISMVALRFVPQRRGEAAAAVNVCFTAERPSFSSTTAPGTGNNSTLLSSKGADPGDGDGEACAGALAVAKKEKRGSGGFSGGASDDSGSDDGCDSVDGRQEARQEEGDMMLLEQLFYDQAAGPAGTVFEPADLDDRLSVLGGLRSLARLAARLLRRCMWWKAAAVRRGRGAELLSRGAAMRSSSSVNVKVAHGDILGRAPSPAALYVPVPVGDEGGVLEVIQTQVRQRHCPRPHSGWVACTWLCASCAVRHATASTSDNGVAQTLWRSGRCRRTHSCKGLWAHGAWCMASGRTAYRVHVSMMD